MRGGEPEPPQRERGARVGRAGVEATPVAGQSRGSPFLLRVPSVSGAAARGPGRREGPGLAKARPPPPGPGPTTPAEGAGRLWLGLRETDGRGPGRVWERKRTLCPPPSNSRRCHGTSPFPSPSPRTQCPRPSQPETDGRTDIAAIYLSRVPRLGSDPPLNPVLPLGARGKGMGALGEFFALPPGPARCGWTGALPCVVSVGVQGLPCLPLSPGAQG